MWLAKRTGHTAAPRRQTGRRADAPAPPPINSNQPGADIHVDRMFVGDAPAVIRLRRGGRAAVLQRDAPASGRVPADHRRLVAIAPRRTALRASR